VKGKVISSHIKGVEQIKNTDNEKDNYYITTPNSTTKR